MTSEAQKKAVAKYQKDRYKMLTVKLDKQKDRDIILHLDGMKNKMEYIRGLIRKDMRKSITPTLKCRGLDDLSGNR